MAASFIDKARIFCRAGKGGNGAVAFHREKYIAAGGPDGGDGGNGGNIVLVVDDNMSTLMDFRYKRKYSAPNGEDGRGARCKGKRGEDLIIKVPRGTVVRDAETNEVIKDMSTSEDYVLCKGGRGGWGNQHFATPTRQVPRFAKAGLPGEERDVILELKLLADVGLVGFPNVGKSTLLSVTSNAHPKIANYHFTTLYPNLGVIYVADGVSFVMADIPGIIEGAADGVGLGHDFLPVDLRAAQGVAHGAEEHHIHALGVAQLDGDLTGLHGDGAEILLHGLQATGGIFLLAGGDGEGVHLIVVDNGHARGLQKLGIAHGLHLLQGHEDIRLTPAEHGGIDLLAPADLGGHAAAPLGHAVDLALLDIVAGLHEAVGHDLGDQDGALTAYAAQQHTLDIGHLTSPPSRWRQRGRPGRRRCSPHTA